MQQGILQVLSVPGEGEAPPERASQVMPAPIVYQAVAPQYPTLLTPWRQHGPGCVCCTNCVPHTGPPARNPCVAYFQVPAAPACEAGDRRTIQELYPVALPMNSVSLPRMAPQTSHISPLPSKGSALHADGKCSPCAWFWKPQGCHHGEECGRCHLCPASEIKVRRKAKVMAKDQQKVDAQMCLGRIKQMSVFEQKTWQS